MSCKGCGRHDDLRFGFCFDCACLGEARAANRSVVQHLLKGLGHLIRGYRLEAKYDFRWAWERMTRTGDYAPLGEFERSYGIRA